MPSMLKQCGNVTAAAENSQNQHVLVLDAVDDDVLAYRKALQAGT
jgi:hypothetical protein